jgi:iron complex transport system substrate-binding protein
LAPNLTELAYQAGAGEQLIAAVEYSDYPEVAKDLPRIGDSFRIDFELLRQLNPDLILVWESGNPLAMQERLREMGFNLLVLEPQTLDDVAAHLRLIGQVAGTQTVAESAAEEYLAELDDIWQRYSAVPDTRIFFQISASPWYTVNGSHLISQILQRCGGSNVFADLPRIAAAVSLESIIAADPEVIIAPVADADETLWQNDWARFSQVAAVREQNFVNVDRDAVSRSSLRLASAARHMCAELNRIRSERAAR